MVIHMPDFGESPNPYESPRTVTTGQRTPVPKQRGPRSRDLKNQTVGFAVLTATGLLGVVVALGAAVLVGKLPDAPAWDWLAAGLRIGCLILVVLSVPAVLMCAPWTLWSAARWAMIARGDHYLEPEDAE